MKRIYKILSLYPDFREKFEIVNRMHQRRNPSKDYVCVVSNPFKDKEVIRSLFTDFITCDFRCKIKEIVPQLDNASYVGGQDLVLSKQKNLRSNSHSSLSQKDKKRYKHCNTISTMNGYSNKKDESIAPKVNSTTGNVNSKTDEIKKGCKEKDLSGGYATLSSGKSSNRSRDRNEGMKKVKNIVSKEEAARLEGWNVWMGKELSRRLRMTVKDYLSKNSLVENEDEKDLEKLESKICGKVALGLSLEEKCEWLRDCGVEDEFWKPVSSFREGMDLNTFLEIQRGKEGIEVFVEKRDKQSKGNKFDGMKCGELGEGKLKKMFDFANTYCKFYIENKNRFS